MSTEKFNVIASAIKHLLTLVVYRMIIVNTYVKKTNENPIPFNFWTAENFLVLGTIKVRLDVV